LKHGYNVLMV